jgi:cell division protein FtsB
MASRSLSSRLLPRRLAMAAVLLLSGLSLGAAIAGARDLLRLHALEADEAEVSRRIAGLLRENERLRTRLHRLRTDDRYLERLVREQLGFVRPGEIVYRFPAAERPDPAAPPR